MPGSPTWMGGDPRHGMRRASSMGETRGGWRQTPGSPFGEQLHKREVFGTTRHIVKARKLLAPPRH